MDSTCRIVGWKLEVADRYARESVKSFESNVLAEGNTIEDCAKSSNPKFVSVNRPSKAGAMQKERGECGKPAELLSVLSPKKCGPELTAPHP